MPSTFTHPLAVLLFRRFCPAPLNFAGLVIGSMAPDFGYYLQQFPLASFAHTIPGSFVVCLPTGLMALALFYLLRRPLCFILPQPHRGALTPLASRPLPLSPVALLSAAASVLLGAWTHTIWDSFTHSGAWSVERVPFLREPLFHVGNTAFAGSYIFQQVSTFVGGVALIAVYFIWLRHRRTGAVAEDAFSERQRYCLLAALAVVALAVAVPAALGIASKFTGYLAFRVLVFRTAIYFVAVFVPLLAVASAGLYAMQRNPDVRQ